MIRASDLAIELGGRAILDRVAFTVADGRVLGIVGPNGSGKTTLLRALVGELAPDRGATSLDGARVGYLRQIHTEAGATPVGAVYSNLFAAASLESALAAAGERLSRATGAEWEEASATYDGLLRRIGQTAPTEVLETARAELSLRPVDAAAAVDTLSGGELGKLGLLDLIAPQPQALLLDEPTNHFDLDGIAWLDRYLDTFPGPIVLVSHDRALLDDHVDQLLVLADGGNRPSCSAATTRRGSTNSRGGATTSGRATNESVARSASCVAPSNRPRAERAASSSARSTSTTASAR